MSPRGASARPHLYDRPLGNEPAEEANVSTQLGRRVTDVWYHHPQFRSLVSFVAGLAVATIVAVFSGGREYEGMRRDVAEIPAIKREVREMRDALIRLEARFDTPTGGRASTRGGYLQFVPPAGAPSASPEEKR